MNRLEWILGIVLVLLLLVAAGLAVSLWIQPKVASQPIDGNPVIANYADDVAQIPQTKTQTAKGAFAIAQQKAQGWQSDAMLVSASATWPQGARPEYIKQGVADWGFTFHSPGTGANAVVTVVNGEPVLIQGDSNNSTEVLQSSNWQIDSTDVLKQFLNEGGEAFLNLEGISILTTTFSANDPNSNGRLEWLVSAFATQSGNSITMRIDAASGEILEVIHGS